MIPAFVFVVPGRSSWTTKFFVVSGRSLWLALAAPSPDAFAEKVPWTRFPVPTRPEKPRFRAKSLPRRHSERPARPICRKCVQKGRKQRVFARLATIRWSRKGNIPLHPDEALPFFEILRLSQLEDVIVKTEWYLIGGYGPFLTVSRPAGPFFKCRRSSVDRAEES